MLSRSSGQSPLIIGVCGGSGAGKTSVVRAIIQALGQDDVAELAEDAYYREYQHLSEAERTRINWDHPDAIEVELLLEHINRLRAGETIQRPIYDFAAYARASETVTIAPKPVLIIEGILIFVEPALREIST